MKCRQAKPKAKPYKFTDSSGLYLEVQPSGGKFWRFRYEVIVGGKRKEKLYSMGDFVLPPRAEFEKEAQIRRQGRRLTLAEACMGRDRVRGISDKDFALRRNANHCFYCNAKIQPQLLKPSPANRNLPTLGRM